MEEVGRATKTIIVVEIKASSIAKRTSRFVPP